MDDKNLLIERLERLAIVLDELMPGCAELVRDAIAMLKEQEAVEPRKKDDGNPQPWTAWWYVCGDCGQEIEYHDRYCRWCGKPVKWD